MERGVLVGGLMICGSFLLAAMLNRSAMEERHAPLPIEAVAPIAPNSVQPIAAPAIADCAAARTPADANGSTATAEPAASDLMVNGREACPR